MIKAAALLLLLSSEGVAFSPSSQNRASTKQFVVSDPSSSLDVDSLVTKEANIKPTLRTKPTSDPFNPDFESIKAVPYSDAFPQSTKEYKTVVHEPTVSYYVIKMIALPQTI